MPNSKNQSPFFVGYLPMPAALRRFYAPLAAALIALCGLAGYHIAAQQHSHAAATWNTVEAVTITGVLTLTPYPVLHRLHSQEGAVESVLLVAQGKHSAAKFAAGFDRKSVAVTGHEIRRGGWVMLEVAAADAFAEVEEDAELNARLAMKSLGEVSLRGEVADSKCFLGVMKPGAGKVHKACAEVCLLGGIPPMLLAKDAEGTRFGYLLTTADGAAAGGMLAEYAGDSVEVEGELVQYGDLVMVEVEGVRRL